MDIIPDQQPYIHEIPADWYHNKISSLAMLRLDVLDKDISGNKWFKLKENVDECMRQSKKSVLTFGGGYSNHLSATAAMTKRCGIHSIGVVRGEYRKLTPTLEFCKDMGMELYFVSYDEYSHKTDGVFLSNLSEQFNCPYIIPEGGANEEGRVGAESITNYIPDKYNHIALSVGTGTTLIGIVNSANVTVLGYAPMKGGEYLSDEIIPFVKSSRREAYSIKDKWHFGGFGKCNETLIGFMNDFYVKTDIPLDRVYTAKMMFGIQEQILSDTFQSDVNLLCIHTGGLQGNISIQSELKY